MTRPLRECADRHLYAAETFRDIAEKLPDIVAAATPDAQLQTLAVRSVLLRVAECEATLAARCIETAREEQAA